MYTQTASIGNAVLLSSLYQRPNHIRYVERKILNEFDTGCYTCPHFRSEHCASCKSRVFDTAYDKVYVNEKNRFGTRKSLKRNALLLFMYFHFMGPDKNGLIQFDSEEAAEKLHCNERSISNNLKLLAKHNYISYTPGTYPGAFRVFISNYKDYFKKSQAGGRGYTIISSAIFEQLTGMKDINTIRLALRNLLPIDTNYSDIQKSYKELKSLLPEYCTKNTIKQITSSMEFKEIFTTSQKKRYVNIVTKEKYNPTSIAEHLKQDCRNAVLEKVTAINEFVEQSNLRFKIHLNDSELKDISNIALRVPIQFICEAFEHIYSNYVSKNLRITNMGALVRTISEYNAEIAALV